MSYPKFRCWVIPSYSYGGYDAIVRQGDTELTEEDFATFDGVYLGGSVI